MRTFRLALSISASMAALLAATTARADDDAPEGTRPAEEIVVTAQKREQALLDVPQSVSVVSGDTLERNQAITFQDYLKLIPGLQVSQSNPGEARVVLRGINTGGVSATVEYAVAVLGVHDIIVCGHSDCGAMKGLAGDPAALAAIPTVANWLKHGAAARQIVDQTYPDLTDAERIRALSLENVVAQLAHLRTHPSVAAGIAQGKIALHGWFIDIHDGTVLALDGITGRFRPLDEGGDFPVAQPAAPRQASDVEFLAAAE